MISYKIMLKAIALGCICLMFLLSCTQHEQKADDAFDRLKKEKLRTKDSVVITEEPMLEPKKNVVVKKAESPDEWTKFKIETESKIIANESKIRELKGNPNSKAKLLKKIATIEKHNNDLRKQMDVYNEDVKVMWENFKVKMRHDVNEIEIDLKDLKINNPK